TTLRRGSSRKEHTSTPSATPEGCWHPPRLGKAQVLKLAMVDTAYLVADACAHPNWPESETATKPPPPPPPVPGSGQARQAPRKRLGEGAGRTRKKPGGRPRHRSRRQYGCKHQHRRTGLRICYEQDGGNKAAGHRSNHGRLERNPGRVRNDRSHQF